LTAVDLNNVTRRFAGYTAIESLNLQVRAGRFVSLVGPSGCGKSTVLNLVAGLIAPSEGTVEVRGRAGYMFQQDALLPWKTVLDNVSLGLDFKGVPAAEARLRAREWIARAGLKGFEDRYPRQLSGGMRKRATMAQTWIVDPEIVLMDEPFSALDVHTRHRMEGEILQLWAGSGKTVLFVTHDLEEAIALSDEVALLSAGPASRVIGSYTIDLPRPRNLLDMKTDARFVEIYRAIWARLRDEVVRSHEG
jgi:NitT/TauT family transport system ATP-binding protein